MAASLSQDVPESATADISTQLKDSSHEPEIQSQVAKPVAEGPAENEEYVTGFKLLAITGSVTLVVFLLLLDQSILSTVRTTPYAAPT